MNRGEIWLVNLNPTIDREMGKTRPAIIVNNNLIGILPLKVIVPITDWKERYNNRPWMIKLEANNSNGLTKNSAADTFQVRSISQSRLVKKLGKLNNYEMKEITAALAIVLKIDN